MGQEGALARLWKYFCALVVTAKRSVDELFLHYIHNLSSASGCKSPDLPGPPSLDPAGWLSSPDPWRLRGNIIRTAPCWVVWHYVYSQQHTYVSSSYRSSRLGLSHCDSYAMHGGGCLELYYCNMVEWCWWDSDLICKPMVSFSALTLLVWSYDL